MSSASDPGRDTLDEKTLDHLQQQASRVAARSGLSRDDQHDLAQELVLHVLEQRHRFDRERGSFSAFAGQVIAHKAADLAKARRTQRRGHGLSIRSLQEPFLSAEGEQLTLEEIAGEDALRTQLGLRSPDFSEQTLLAADVQRVVASLTPAQRDLCQRLVAASSITEVALDLGLSRAAVYKALVRLRKVFRGAGIAPASPGGGDTSRAVVVPGSGSD